MAIWFLIFSAYSAFFFSSFSCGQIVDGDRPTDQ
jgi:hypothetical protein